MKGLVSLLNLFSNFIISAHTVIFSGLPFLLVGIYGSNPGPTRRDGLPYPKWAKWSRSGIPSGKFGIESRGFETVQPTRNLREPKSSWTLFRREEINLLLYKNILNLKKNATTLGGTGSNHADLSTFAKIIISSSKYFRTVLVQRVLGSTWLGFSDSWWWSWWWWSKVKLGSNKINFLASSHATLLFASKVKEMCPMQIQ